MIKASPTDYDALTKLVIARELKRGAHCVDAGCHSGETVDMMLEYPPEGYFYCFEHGPGAADCYGTTPEAIFALLSEDCGLHIYCLHDFLDGQGSLQKSQFCEYFYSGAHYYFLAHRS